MNNETFEMNIEALIAYAERLELDVGTIDWDDEGGDMVAIYFSPINHYENT